MAGRLLAGVIFAAAAGIGGGALAEGGFTVRITETPEVSQPGPFATRGTTVVVPRTRIEIEDRAGGRRIEVPAGATRDQLTERLQALGAGPGEIAAVLAKLKAAGALQGEVRTR